VLSYRLLVERAGITGDKTSEFVGRVVEVGDVVYADESASVLAPNTKSGCALTLKLGKLFPHVILLG
jgi:hypothetical protein